MHIVVDPYLISMPIAGKAQAQDVRDYAQRLTAWEKEAGTKNGHYVVSGAVQAVLMQEGLFPTPENLQRLFSLCGIEEFSSRDIAADCNGFLANCAYLEDVSGANHVYPELEQVEGSESVIPDEMRRRLPELVAKAFVTSLLYAACAIHDRPSKHSWSIATAPVANEAPQADLQLVGTVRRLGRNGDEIVEITVEHEWPLLVEPDYLYASYAIDQYLDQPEIATRIAWCKLKAEDSKTASIEHTYFSFGRQFVKSLRDPKMQRRPDLGCDIADVFYTIVAVLQGMPFGSDRHHPLRMPLWSHSARIQTRERTAGFGVTVWDEAARVEVCGGTMPLRLHYWRCHDGTYEFSNVTTDHDDPTIY